MDGEPTGLGDGEEGAVIGFKIGVKGYCVRPEARFCLTKRASGREGEEQEEGRLTIDSGVRSTEEDALSPKLVGPACVCMRPVSSISFSLFPL
jgi:hypothetical protein